MDINIKLTTKQVIILLGTVTAELKCAQQVRQRLVEENAPGAGEARPQGSERAAQKLADRIKWYDNEIQQIEEILRKIKEAI